MITLPKVLPAVFSYEGMKEKWDEDNPDEPYTRRADLDSGRYALDKWLIRVNDEGKTIAAIGWKEHSTHTVVGGMLASSEGRELGGNSRDLVETRQPQLPANNPMVSAFGHQSGDNKRWMAGGRKGGWAFPNDPKFQEYSQLIPEEVLNDWLSQYPTNMGIKPNNAEDLAKAIYFDDIHGDWFNLFKSERYVISLGKKGYEVIDTDSNKAVNRTGLSKTKANNMLAAINRGETNLTQYEADVKQRASRSRWKTILRKKHDWSKDIGSQGWIDAVKAELNAKHTGMGVFEFDYKNKTHHFNMHYLTNPPEVIVNGWGKNTLMEDPINMAKRIKLIVDKHIDLQAKIGE